MLGEKSTSSLPLPAAAEAEQMAGRRREVHTAAAAAARRCWPVPLLRLGCQPARCCTIDCCMATAGTVPLQAAGEPEISTEFGRARLAVLLCNCAGKKQREGNRTAMGPEH